MAAGHRFRGYPALARRVAALVVLLVVTVAATAGAAKKTPPAQPIDLNTATLKELEQLPGVGPTTAKAIIEFRTRSGHFRRISDLLVIRGISETKLQKMRPYVTIGSPPLAPKKAPPVTSTKPAPAAPLNSQPKPSTSPPATPPS